MSQNSADFNDVLNFIRQKKFQSALSVLGNCPKGSSIFVESNFRILRNAAFHGSPLIVKHILFKLEKTEISDAIHNHQVLQAAVRKK